MSEKDTDRDRSGTGEERTTEARAPKGTSSFEQSLVENAKVIVPAAIIVGAGIAARIQGAAAAILVLAGGALLGVIVVFWSSLRTLLGETPLTGADAYAIGAPPAEEERKRAVLRALKDLEFERSVGKISEEDYELLVTKYREEGKRLLRAIDEGAGPERERAAAFVAERLRDEGLLEGDAPPAPRDEDEEDAAPAPKPKARKKKKKKAAPKAEAAPAPRDDADDDAGPTCASCGTVNDEDALFCKKCGARQKKPTEAAPDQAEKEAP